MSDSTLFTTAHGSAIRCACCDRIEVTFRGIPFLLTEDDLPVVQSVFQSIGEAEADPGDVWEMSATTGNGPVTVHYRHRDLLEFGNLIDGTAAMLELEEIIADLTLDSA
ncbi:hypothetical protein CRI94_10845 [Longibacter salinarum]|uniref:Uncharacterized protein n=1 Tax=Longibacter salinarum TaxID=1850348 RepID=A0A2A8CX41_9BACT|nr:hypothetical protein [Longibacter salinarum]PEN13137.1 hypothetical protein CRI94_10845 [Longibacter salinarum]